MTLVILVSSAKRLYEPSQYIFTEIIDEDEKE
jgi:hypothetical protein